MDLTTDTPTEHTTDTAAEPEATPPPAETPEAADALDLHRWARARRPAVEPVQPAAPTLDERREELVDLAAEGARLFVVATLPSGERRCCTGVVVDVGRDAYRLRQAEGRERVFKIALIDRVERRP